MGDYLIALTNPFDPRALGCRVPDQWAFPTATFHTQGTITVTSNGSGVASVLMTPYPFYSLVDCTQTSVTAGNTTMAAYASTNTVYAATTVANMGAVLSEYRVVAAGIKIRNLMPPTTATGRLLNAHTPCAGPVPGPTKLANIGISNSQMSLLMSGTSFGAATSGLPSSILQLPDSHEFTAQDIIASEYSFNYKPITPNAFRFRDCDQTVLTGGIAFGDVAVSTSAPYGNLSTALTVDNIETEDVDGWDNYQLRFEGGPASANVFEIEYIFHYEGSPLINTTAGNLFPTSRPVTHVDLPKFHSAVSRALSAASHGLKLVESGQSHAARYAQLAARVGMSFL